MIAFFPPSPPFYLEALQFIVTVYKQLRLVAIDTDQDHVFWAVLNVAANQFVGGAIGEELGIKMNKQTKNKL